MYGVFIILDSLAYNLTCLVCSAGGMALSTLVPATVSSISMLAKSSLPGLQIWSLHGLLLTVEAAGLSFVSHVQVIRILFFCFFFQFLMTVNAALAFHQCEILLRPGI